MGGYCPDFQCSCVTAGPYITSVADTGGGGGGGGGGGAVGGVRTPPPPPLRPDDE